MKATNIDMAPLIASEEPSDAELMEILDHRYGDGIVYLPKNRPWSLFCTAQKLGFISDDGFVTGKGRSLLAQHRSN